MIFRINDPGDRMPWYYAQPPTPRPLLGDGPETPRVAFGFAPYRVPMQSSQGRRTRSAEDVAERAELVRRVTS